MTGFIQYLDDNCNYNPNPFLVTAREETQTKNTSRTQGDQSSRARLVSNSPTHLEKEPSVKTYTPAKVSKPPKSTQKRTDGLKERDVFERLTDHRYFTGIHRERFDENGRGRGLAGREYLYLFDGSTESRSRAHEVYSSVLPRQRKKVIQPGTLGVQKFGVQIATPRLMWLYRNGDKHHDGVPFYVRPFIRTMETLLLEINKHLTLIAGPVRKIYDQNLTRVTDLRQIVDGAKYLCTSGEPPAPVEKLQKFLSQWVIQKMF